jgi:hypothetical protein
VPLIHKRFQFGIAFAPMVELAPHGWQAARLGVAVALTMHATFHSLVMSMRLYTVPLISTKLLAIRSASRVLCFEVMATLNTIACRAAAHNSLLLTIGPAACCMCRTVHKWGAQDWCSTHEALMNADHH